MMTNHYQMRHFSKMYIFENRGPEDLHFDPEVERIAAEYRNWEPDLSAVDTDIKVNVVIISIAWTILIVLYLTKSTSMVVQFFYCRK